MADGWKVRSESDAVSSNEAVEDWNLFGELENLLILQERLVLEAVGYEPVFCASFPDCRENTVKYPEIFFPAASDRGIKLLMVQAFPVEFPDDPNREFLKARREPGPK